MSNGTRSDNNAACTPVANPVSTLLLVLNDPDAVAQINAHDLVGLGGRFDTPIIGAARHRPKISFICLLFIYTIASAMECTALNCFQRQRRKEKVKDLKHSGGISNLYEGDIEKAIGGSYHDVPTTSAV
jgi:hypothetical protein